MIVPFGQTPIYFNKVENVQEHYDLLLPFINDDSYWRTAEEWESKTQTTMGSKKNLELPWNKILPDVEKHLQEYLNIFGPAKAFGIETRPWLNRYEQGAWQEQHNHLGAKTHFSMAYVIDSQNQSNFVFSDSGSNWYDYMGLNSYFQNWPKRTFVPEQESGTIFIFPSNVDHFVLPNQSEKYRITASANFYLQE